MSGVTIRKLSEIKQPERQSRRNVNKAINTLQKQGLIEPIIITNDMEVSSINWYDAIYIQAAKELDWDTVITVFEDEVKNEELGQNMYLLHKVKPNE